MEIERTRIDISHCAKTYADGTRGLQPTDLTVEPGEVLALLGPSGCGKTTLLRLIAGLESPDAGSRIRFGETDVTAIPIEQRNVGMVFLHYALFPQMTVQANIGYGLKIRGTPEAERQRIVGELVDLVRLNGLEKKRPSELSGGQRQRVALARAVAAKPRHDRDFLLPFAGSAIQGQRLPLVVCVVQVAARAVNAGEGHIRALRPLAAALRHHPRGQPVCRVLANGNRLFKARVVGRGVFHQRGGRAVLQRHRLQIRSARARHPCAGLPAVGLAVRRQSKIAVGNQVARLRRVVLPARPKQRKENRRRGEQRKQNDDPDFLTFFHFNPPRKIKT